MRLEVLVMYIQVLRRRCHVQSWQCRSYGIHANKPHFNVSQAANGKHSSQACQSLTSQPDHAAVLSILESSSQHHQHTASLPASIISRTQAPAPHPHLWLLVEQPCPSRIRPTSHTAIRVAVITISTDAETTCAIASNLDICQTARCRRGRHHTHRRRSLLFHSFLCCSATAEVGSSRF